jgi:hypothetical protein
MKKGHNRVTFKPYTMDQPALLPPTLDELVPKDHLVRVVNQTIDVLNIDVLLQRYKGGGTSSFHPKMMLKVMVYARRYIHRGRLRKHCERTSNSCGSAVGTNRTFGRSIDFEEA